MNDTTYLIDEFVNVQPGKPFRLFPFGKLVKGGKEREITPELASQFRLPHFRPAIKLGSHADTTAAGGFIVGLEVRDDGLYAIPEYNEEGNEALEKGAYRYHSPEVIWDGWLENPNDGSKIAGPLIVGDALLHTPHLGEATALYSIDVIGDEIMTTNQDMVSVSTLDKIFGWFSNQTSPAVDLEPIQTPEPQENYQAQYEEAQGRIDHLTAQVAEFEQARVRGERVQHFAAEFNEVEAVENDQELFGILADMPEEQANALVVKIKAIAEQARVSNLTTDLGNPGGEANGDPTVNFDAAIKKVMADKNISYPKALDVVRTEQPDVFKAYFGGN